MVMREPFKTMSVEAFRDVGGYIMSWGQLESQITVAIAEMQPGCAGPHVSESKLDRMLTSVIRKWFTIYCDTTSAGIERAKLLKARLGVAADFRNVLAHGVDGLWFGDDEYTITCFERFHRHLMLGQFPPRREITQTELRAAYYEVDAMQREIAALKALALSRPRKPKARKAQL